jgi:hypothetical protein
VSWALRSELQEAPASSVSCDIPRVDRKGSNYYIEAAAFLGVRQANGTEGWCMAKAKKTKPREQIRWRVSLMTKTLAKFIDFAYAPSAEAAEKQVAEEHEISEALRNKLVAIRDEL